MNEECTYLYDDPHTGEIIDRCTDAAVKDGLCQYHQPATPEQAQREAEAALEEMRGNPPDNMMADAAAARERLKGFEVKDEDMIDVTSDVKFSPKEL